MSEKKWKTAGGVVVVLRGAWIRHPGRRGRPAWKVMAYRESGGFHGLLWLKNLTPVKP